MWVGPDSEKRRRYTKEVYSLQVQYSHRTWPFTVTAQLRPQWRHLCYGYIQVQVTNLPYCCSCNASLSRYDLVKRRRECLFELDSLAFPIFYRFVTSKTIIKCVNLSLSNVKVFSYYWDSFLSVRDCYVWVALSDVDY